MARVTVEDCIDKVVDRFELVALAAQRAKAISAGEPLTIDRNGEKNSVLSLREIAQETVGVENLRDELVKSLQKEREIQEIFGDDVEETPSEAAEMMRIESEATEPVAVENTEKSAISAEGEPEEGEAPVDFSFEDEQDIED